MKKKPTKSQIEKWSRTYYDNNRESIRKKRNVEVRKQNNSSEIIEAKAIQKKNKEAFDKSFFGRELLKQKMIR